MARTRHQIGYQDIAGDWMDLQRLWEKVVARPEAVGSRSGGWDVRKEYSGEGLGPIAGDFDEVAVYIERGHRHQEVGRWPLEEVQQYDG